MIYTTDDKKSFETSLLCHICGKPLNGDSVRDHCHITGKFIGASHYECNINRNYKNFKIPVFFHNGEGTILILLLMRLQSLMKSKGLI